MGKRPHTLFSSHLPGSGHLGALGIPQDTQLVLMCKNNSAPFFSQGRPGGKQTFHSSASQNRQLKNRFITQTRVDGARICCKKKILIWEAGSELEAEILHFSLRGSAKPQQGNSKIVSQDVQEETSSVGEKPRTKSGLVV